MGNIKDTKSAIHYMWYRTDRHISEKSLDLLCCNRFAIILRFWSIKVVTDLRRSYRFTPVSDRLLQSDVWNCFLFTLPLTYYHYIRDVVFSCSLRLMTVFLSYSVVVCVQQNVWMKYTHAKITQVLCCVVVLCQTLSRNATELTFTPFSMLRRTRIAKRRVHLVASKF